MQKLTPHAKLFSESWALYKKNWLNWGLILVVPLVLSFLILILGGGIWSIGNLILLIVLIIAMGVVQVWAELTLLMAVSGNAKKMNVLDAYKHSWPRLWAFFGLSVLLFLVLLGAFALLIIPGIILSIFLCFSVWSLVDENQRGLSALTRSKHLVSGYWLPVFGRLFVLGLAVGLFQFLISSVLDAVGVPYEEQITNAILTFTAGPIAAAYTFLLYKNLKSIKGTAKVAATPGEKNGYIALAILGFIAPVLIIAFSMIFFVSSVGQYSGDDAFFEGLEDELTEELQNDLGIDEMGKEDRKDYLRALMGQ